MINLSDSLLGSITVHNIKTKTKPYRDTALADIYIGRPSSRLKLRGSVLANPYVMKNYSDDERLRVCKEYTQDLVKSLETQEGPLWAEIERLVLLVKAGAKIRMFCYCNPKLCHGDSLALTVYRLAEDFSIAEVVKELNSMFPA